MSPRSSDQKPPGVSGWVAGNPRISRDSHGPGVHVPFVTSMVTPERGWTLDEHARAVRKRNGTATERSARGLYIGDPASKESPYDYSEGQGATRDGR